MESVSRAAEDYVKAIWSALEWGGDPITVKRLAERFAVTPATVSNTIARLGSQGLVRHAPYEAIELTPEGERLAIAVVRRHRLIETFLVEHVGYSWNEVHLEAESLEHAVSDLLIDRIDDLLGNPSVDPHGDPIPDRFGGVAYPAGAQPLSAAALGTYRAVRISDDDPDQLARFESDGLVTDVTLTVVSRTPEGATEVALDDRSVLLPPSAADAVMVVAREALATDPVS